MPLITNEQDVKRPSQFLEYETGDMGNQLIIKSHLYKTLSHFLPSPVSRSVACHEDTCLYCTANYRQNVEYNYFAYLNGQLGFLNVKSGPFFAMQKIAKAQNRDTREISWTVIKTGSGLDTKYTTSKDDNLSPEDVAQAKDELETNTKKLVDFMEKQEATNEENYTKYLHDIKNQAGPGRAKETRTETVEKPVSASDDEVDPEDIPF